MAEQHSARFCSRNETSLYGYRNAALQTVYTVLTTAALISKENNLGQLGPNKLFKVTENLEISFNVGPGERVLF